MLHCAARWRCPNCARGRLFGGWFAMLHRCPECRLSYYPESGFYVGAMIVNYVVVAALVTALYLFGLLVPDLPGISWNLRIVMWLVFAIALSLALMRHSYSFWLAANFWIDPWEPEAQHSLPHHSLHGVPPR
jgi:uncharacterized protein (DUF983 family)